MANDFESGFETILAAVTDGRTENVRYRQNELHRLHAGLRDNADAICTAIANSAPSTVAEAETEFFLATDSIRQSYENLDFDKSIKDEYLVTTGADNLGRRNGLGLVAIQPSKHSRFYSIVNPLAAAIAEGNCVVLDLGSSRTGFDTLLSSILTTSLDQDTFYITTTILQPEHLSKVNLLVNQNGAPSLTKTLSSPAHSLSIAVIDRSANVGQAAKAIVSARLFTQGTSPYAPDLVIVNEFIKDAFSKACFEYANVLDIKNTSGGVGDVTKEILKDAEGKGQIKIHETAPGLILVEVTDRSCDIIRSKVTGPYIITLPSSGIVDSVSTQRSSSPLATYLFASPQAAKFLSEQIDSQVSYINQIPPQLLIGPRSPSDFPQSLHPRYTPAMFSKLRPQYITPAPALPGKLREAAIVPLKPTGQKPGHAVGFFEQGIFLGFGLTVFVVFPSVGYALFRLTREGWRYYASK